MGDQFSDHYPDLLEGGYDCVDRIVLNACFPMGVSAAGFRYWWRLLHGTDANPDFSVRLFGADTLWEEGAHLVVVGKHGS